MFDGSYTQKINGSNDITLHCYGYNFQGGQYKLMVEKHLGQLCDFFFNEMHKEVWEDVMNHSDKFIPGKTCPFPAGLYTIRNYMLKGLVEMIPPYVPGSEKWKGVAEYRLNETVLGGMTFYFTLINDKNMGILVG